MNAGCYAPVPGDQSRNGTGTIPTNSTDDEPGNDPLNPRNPKNSDGTEKSWIQENRTWVIIVALVLFIIIIGTICYCMKQRKEDPYMGKTYSEAGPEKGQSQDFE
jgi:hypothetical protein